MTDLEKAKLSDGDRELVGKLLKVAIDEGRLDLAEYDERLRKAYGAETVAELAPILLDLPRAADGTVSVPKYRPLAAVRAKDGSIGGTPQWIKWLWISWLIPVSITTMVWLLALISGSEVWYFWPAWVAGPLGAVAASITIGEAVTRRDRERQRAAERARRHNAPL